MRCPVDDRELVMSDRNGIEIDYCPECRGVWLDRGELDKIIERSDRPRSDRDRDRDERRSAPAPSDSGSMFGRKRKKEGFLSEIFDFG